MSQEGFGGVLIFLGFLRNIVEKFMYNIIYSKDNKRNFFVVAKYAIFRRNFMKIHHFEELSPCLGGSSGDFPHMVGLCHFGG